MIGAVTMQEVHVTAVVRELASHEIAWAGSAPVERLERLDPLSLTAGELLAHIDQQRLELDAVRTALHVAVELLAQAEEERVRQRRTIDRLYQERRSA